MDHPILNRVAVAFRPELRAEALPEGVIGRVEGIALVYEQVDTHGTVFAEGCLTRTIRERVAAGKVKLYWDHGDAQVLGKYDTDLHIGTVRSLEDRALGDGRRVAWLVADVLDTEEGRKAHEYLRAVLGSGGETGLSIGMLPGTLKGASMKMAGRNVYRLTEVGLREVSIVAEPAVPGASVAAVRADVDRKAVCTSVLRGLVAALGIEQVRAELGALDVSQDPPGNAEAPPDSTAAALPPAASDAGAEDSPAAGTTTRAVATWEARVIAFRQSFARSF